MKSSRVSTVQIKGNVDISEQCTYHLYRIQSVFDNLIDIQSALENCIHDIRDKAAINEAKSNMLADGSVTNHFRRRDINPIGVTKRNHGEIVKIFRCKRVPVEPSQ